jgi:hypothetical protein
MKTEIQIIYPGEYNARFFIETETAVTDHELLERIFAEWNYGSNQESKEFINARVRSLSVNDIVWIGGRPEGSLLGRYYQCASIGWTEVDVNFVNQLEAEVKNHPKMEEGGAFFALSDIMWQRKKAEMAKA